MIKKQVKPSGPSPLLFSVLPWSHSFCNARERLVIPNPSGSDVMTVHNNHPFLNQNFVVVFQEK